MKRIAENTEKRLLYIAAMMILSCIILFSGKNTLYCHAATTVTVAATNAKVRAEASTDSDTIGSAASGTSLTVSKEVTGSDGNVWYQISLNGTVGYIRSDLVTKGEAAPQVQEQPQADNHTETAATVTESSASSGTVGSSSVNVRKGPAATDAVVASAKSGSTVSITGEAVGADGKTWYQVSVGGTTGFIRSDLLNTSGESAPAKDTGTSKSSDDGNKAEEPEEAETPEEGSETETEPEQSEAPESAEGNTEISNVISSRIIPGDVDLTNMTIDAGMLGEWESGNYYVLYTKNADGGDSWYLYSLSDNQFEKITNLHDNGEQAKKDSGAFDLASLLSGKGKIVVLIIAVVFVILLLSCILMAVKLHDYRTYGFEDDEDDDDDDEDDEDDEDDDDEDDEDDDERVSGRRWSPRNFLNKHDEDDDEDDDDEDDEDDDDEDDDDEEDEEEERIYRRKNHGKVVSKSKNSSKGKTVSRSKSPAQARSSAPRKNSGRKMVDDAYLDDDDFEFEFLNMDGKDDIR